MGDLIPNHGAGRRRAESGSGHGVLSGLPDDDHHWVASGEGRVADLHVAEDHRVGRARGDAITQVLHQASTRIVVQIPEVVGSEGGGVELAQTLGRHHH